MLQEYLPGLWLDEVSTGFSGVPYLNMTWIPGDAGGRSLLVDAGLPDPVSGECREAVRRGLRLLRIDPKRLDCIITHSHKDHVGQAALLHSLGARVLMNPVDMEEGEEKINHELLHPATRKKLFRLIGLELSPEDEYREFWRAADDFTNGFEHAWDFPSEAIRPGECRCYGAYRFRLVSLPGHTKGHMGLLDREKKLLFSGDQLVHGVTPIVSDSGDYPEGLDDYLDSMRAVKHVYGDCLFIPGHGKPFRHPEQEVDTVVQRYLNKCSAMYHHLRRAAEPLCIREIGRRTYGRYGRKLSRAEQRSCILIWFKTYACLNYMKRRELVREQMEDGVSMWSAV